MTRAAEMRKAQHARAGQRPALKTSPVAAPMQLSPPGGKQCACGGGCPRCNKKLPLQTKLAVSEPGDAYESEADAVAEQVMTLPEPTVAPTTALPRLRISRTPSANASAPSRGVPSSVHDTLRSSGQPLDNTMRDFFEPRFGFDLSRVQIHTDARAAASAQAVGARAYTAGNHVVFGNGEYAPHSTSGRRLLAHELTHVAQQSRGATTLQRAPAGKSNCPPFPPPGFAALVTDSAYGPPPIFEGSKGKFSVMSDRKVPVDFSYRSVAGPDPGVTPPAEFFGGLHWEFSGDGSFTGGDTDGLGQWVKPTKAGKAEFTLRTVAQNCLMAKIEIGVIEPIVVTDPKKKEEEKEKEKAKEKKKDEPTCGPDIGKQLADVLSEVRSTFAGWSAGDKRKACLEIITFPAALVAWDIHELYLPETGWLRSAPYFPSCGTPGSNDPKHIEDKTLCSNSVEVDGKCFLAGTVNYALFGQMFRLCADAGQPLDMMHPMPLDRSIMKRMIADYKLRGLFDDDGPPSAWAEAGYDGYPGNVPGGSNENRAHCAGRCSVKYKGKPFTYVWEPEHGATER
ncbi:MAG TPA: DUF4157 domain-containing protein [Burkholderiales bacterium]|nr:DUF4157 domain-containing protein [Burkholderiales bacterium]